MSIEEWRCGGNSGRLLSLLFGPQVSFFVHGSRYDAERLRAAVAACKSCCVLFPGASAVTVPQWLAGTSSSTVVAGAGGDAHLCASQGHAVILVDGTWAQARRMEKRLRKFVLPLVSQVSLTLEGFTRVSSFHRNQSQQGRICTAEALALFVGEVCISRKQEIENEPTEAVAKNAGTAAIGCLGTSVSTEERPVAGVAADETTELPLNTEATAGLLDLIREAISVSTRALHPEEASLWKGSGGDPTWYYGEKVINGVNENSFRRSAGKEKSAWARGEKREARNKRLEIIALGAP